MQEAWESFLLNKKNNLIKRKQFQTFNRLDELLDNQEIKLNVNPQILVNLMGQVKVKIVGGKRSLLKINF